MKKVTGVKRNVRTPSDPGQPAGPAQQRPPSHPRSGSCRNSQLGPGWEIPAVVQVTGAAATMGLARPGTGPPKQGVLARRLAPCQHGECSWCVDARSTSCASPALPVVSPLGTRRSSAPDHRVDARPLGSRPAASAIPAAGHHRRADKAPTQTDTDLNAAAGTGAVGAVDQGTDRQRP